MKNFEKLFALSVLLLSGCGKDNNSGGSPAPVILPSPGVQTSGSILLNSVSDLPTCLAANEAQLAYIIESKTFYTCSKATWTQTDIKGEKGDTGAAGAAGAMGPQGSASEVVGLPILYDADDKMLGWLVTTSGSAVDVGGSDINVMLTSGLVTKLNTITGKMPMTPPTGTGFYGNCYYPEQNCVGECRMNALKVIAPSFMAAARSYRQAKGDELGPFMYKSVASYNGAMTYSCANTGDLTMGVSWATEDISTLKSGALYPYSTPFKIKSN